MKNELKNHRFHNYNPNRGAAVKVAKVAAELKEKGFKAEASGGINWNFLDTDAPDDVVQASIARHTDPNFGDPWGYND